MAIEERRVVTVLFADLVGYTALAEHLDPEAVTRLVESYFQPLVVEIEAFGGRVDKVLGDAIIALFGAPVAHEDDADRAVRAALRMQETLARLVAERHDEGDDPVVDIQMRIGINTGEVLVGTVAGSDYTAMGDVVNTASRLQALTPPGSVLIGEATEALCSAAVTREPFGVTQIRGRQQAEQPWVVTGASRRRFPTGAVRHPVRRTPRRVGPARVDDLARAHRPQRRRVDRRRARLREDLASPTTSSPGLADEAIVLETACSPYGETSLWSPLRNGLATLLALDPDATPDDVRRTVEQRSKELWSLQTWRRPARAAARRHRLPVRSSIRARRARSGRGTGPHHRGRHRGDAQPRPDADDGAVGRQPAVGRPECP